VQIAADSEPRHRKGSADLEGQERCIGVDPGVRKIGETDHRKECAAEPTGHPKSACIERSPDDRPIVVAGFPVLGRRLHDHIVKDEFTIDHCIGQAQCASKPASGQVQRPRNPGVAKIDGSQKCNVEKAKVAGNFLAAKTHFACDARAFNLFELAEPYELLEVACVHFAGHACASSLSR
jgi:hypothetical protein